MPPLKTKPASKKPPSRAWKPTAKAKAAKEAPSDEDIPDPKKKKAPAKSKTTCKKKVLELSDSDDEEQGRGENYHDSAGDDAGDDTMNRHLNHCEKVDGQSGMAIQRWFNDENRSWISTESPLNPDVWLPLISQPFVPVCHFLNFMLILLCTSL